MAQPSTIGSFRLMRRIDQYLGPPLCMALALVPSLAARVSPPTPAAVRNLLVIKFWGMGSIVLATPALRALKRAYPAARITFLTFEQNEPICRMITAIDRVHPFRASGPLVFAASFVRLLRVLWRERFDVVLDFEFFANFTAIITALSRARVRVGFHTPKWWRARFYSIGVPFDRGHITENFLQAVEALGATADDGGLDELVVSDPTAATTLERVLAERDVRPDEPLICINVNASALDYKRRWPLPYYRGLIERLLAHGEHCRVVLTGAREDAPYVAALMAVLPASPNVVNLCGVLNLAQLVRLLQRARLFIGNDSGPLHLAAAAGVPTVSFFGPESPAMYGPRGSAHTVLYRGIACSPCLNVHNSKDNSACRNNVCLQSISVDDAWEAVRARLAEPRPWSAEGAAL